MQRFSAKSLLALGLLIGLVSFNACQKEDIRQSSLQPAISSTDRSPEHFTYGVTVYGGINNPSVIVEIDEATGLVTNQFQAAVLDPNNQLIPIEDLKGIARTSWGQFFITTGDQNTNPLYNNTLLKVNVNLPWGPLGMCSFFNSISPNGPVSDLEFNPGTQTFFGLQNNSNNIVEIQLDINGNYTVYTNPAAITGIQSRVLSGLSLVRDNTGVYFVGAASRPTINTLSGQLYRVPAAGGAAALMTDLAPLGDFAGGHCGIGFDANLNHLAINRTTFTPGVQLGLSEIKPWNAPLPLVTLTAPWGAKNLNFEDLTTWIP